MSDITTIDGVALEKAHAQNDGTLPVPVSDTDVDCGTKSSPPTSPCDTTDTSVSDTSISHTGDTEDPQVKVQKKHSNAIIKNDCSFPVYMIHSKLSLLTLDDILKNFGPVGFLRIVYDNNSKETNLTIAILPHEVYHSLCNEGYGDIQHGSYRKNFRITPFILKENNLPGDGRTKTLFVPVPKILCNDDSQVIAAVEDKLSHLAEWGIIDDKSWYINVPLKSREKGGVRSGCFISFVKTVPIESIAMVRILLTDTYWPEQPDTEDRSVFRCFWARVRKERTDKSVSEKLQQKSHQRDVFKEIQKREKIQKIVKKIKPVHDTKAIKKLHKDVSLSETIPKHKKKSKNKNSPKKKAPTIPITSQPVLKTSKLSK